jgi:shikimate kinase
MRSRPNIVLMGFMGTGKTRVGRILAERRGMRFVDMDDLIVERKGRSIPDIFAVDGEAHFRGIERLLVRELAAGAGYVIATGGGIVLNPDNVADFARSGLVVCLSATPEAILARVEHDTNRPLLTGPDKMERIRNLLSARMPRYRAIPNQVDTTGLTPDEVADAVLRLAEEF